MNLKNPLRKKHSFDNNELLTKRQLMLDKINKILYNIRTRVVEEGTMQEVLLNDLSKNPDLTSKSYDFLRKRLPAVQKAMDETGIKGVIAGGCVRDILLGLHYKDIGLFLFSCEDLDDDNVYFTETIRKYDYHQYERPFKSRGAGYPSSTFITYRSAGYQYDARALDVMSTKNASAEEVLDTFDYDLVRCYFDPLTEKFFVDPRFLTSYHAGRIDPSSSEVRRRALDWRERTGYKIVIGNVPKKAQEASTYASATSTASLNVPDAAYLRNYWERDRQQAAVGDRWVLDNNGNNIIRAN